MSVYRTIGPLVISFADCVDRVDCRLYGPNACTGKFAAWAKDNCPLHCGFCTGKIFVCQRAKTHDDIQKMK